MASNIWQALQCGTAGRLFAKSFVHLYLFSTLAAYLNSLGRTIMNEMYGGACPIYAAAAQLEPLCNQSPIPSHQFPVPNRQSPIPNFPSPKTKTQYPIPKTPDSGPQAFALASVLHTSKLLNYC